MSCTDKIIGRYAPSPSGDLHLGNLRTALLAWLHCRLQGGEFKLRMDDLDLPRVIEGSAEKILCDLEWLGLDWDGPIMYQSQRVEAYQYAFQQLADQGLIYECFCSRKDIQQAASAPHVSSGVYPGSCANLDNAEIEAKRQHKTPASRVRVGNSEVIFNDACVGECRDQLRLSCGDFVVKRADGLFAYQLATAVDDLAQDITDVVRGADLVDSTARQIYLMQRLNTDFAEPRYYHVALMLDDNGDRMAKRFGSISMTHWLAEGRSSSELIGFLAHSAGLIDQPTQLSAQELLSAISYEHWLASIK